jgi:hypothetical protein
MRRWVDARVASSGADWPPAPANSIPHPIPSGVLELDEIRACPDAVLNPKMPGSAIQRDLVPSRYVRTGQEGVA